MLICSILPYWHWPLAFWLCKFSFAFRNASKCCNVTVWKYGHLKKENWYESYFCNYTLNLVAYIRIYYYAIRQQIKINQSIKHNKTIQYSTVKSTHRENSSSSSDAAHEFHTSPWPYCVSKNAPTLASCCFDKHNVWKHVKVLQSDKKNWRIMQLLRQTILETVYPLYYCFN